MSAKFCAKWRRKLRGDEVGLRRAPKPSYRYLNLVTGVFVTCLIISNIIVAKLVGIGDVVMSAAIIIFPVSYIFGDILTEVYGYARSRQIIWIGFACNALAVVAIQIGAALPSADFWTGQAAYEQMLGTTPRFLIASLIAYLVGEFMNSFVLAKMKIVTRGRWLWSRTIGSTLIGEAFDTVIFTLIAFTGALEPGAMVNITVTEWTLKCLYEFVATPVTYQVVNFLKRAEREDYYDYYTDFNPFNLGG
ncbi:MAG: queuosine precursor transporter [Chloroflexi bacterium]|nr:queuosine precursor transporter [Chloroflexota bacterium]